jgi:hypothetical protein
MDLLAHQLSNCSNIDSNFSDLSMNLFDLPTAIFHLVKAYLTLSDYVYLPEKGYSQENEPWMVLMNVSKVLYQLKRETRYLRLSYSNSMKFLHYLNFRKRVDSAIVSRSKQLFLQVRNVQNPSAFTVLADLTIHGLAVDANLLSSNMRDIGRMLSALSVLILTNWKGDFPPDPQNATFEKLQALKLIGSHTNQSINATSFLKTFQKLDIAYTQVTSLSGFFHIEELKANGSALKQINDVASFKIVDISFCNHMKDLSPFSKVYKINISNCNILDLTPIKDVPIVIAVSLCSFVNDSFILPVNSTIQKLTFSPELSNEVMKLNNKSIKLEGVSLLLGVEDFAAFTCLTLSTNYHDVESPLDLSHLHAVRELSVTNYSLDPIMKLVNLIKLFLKDCSFVNKLDNIFSDVDDDDNDYEDGPSKSSGKGSPILVNL